MTLGHLLCMLLCSCRLQTCSDFFSWFDVPLLLMLDGTTKLTGEARPRQKANTVQSLRGGGHTPGNNIKFGRRFLECGGWLAYQPRPWASNGILHNAINDVSMRRVPPATIRERPNSNGVELQPCIVLAACKILHVTTLYHLGALYRLKM